MPNSTDDPPRYPCPCCGFLVFGEEPGSYDICGICGWEDDPVQLLYPLAGGANPPLLQEQKRFLATLTDETLEALRARGLVRCPDWRPLNASDIRPDDPGPRSGMEYFDAIPCDRPEYYWRKPSQQRDR